MYLFLAVLGRCCCKPRLFSSCAAQASRFGVFSCRRAQALAHVSFSSRGWQALEHRLSSRGACKCLVALRHVKSSRTGHRTHEAHIGR